LKQQLPLSGRLQQQQAAPPASRRQSRPRLPTPPLPRQPSAQKGFKLAIQGGLAPQGVEEQLAYVNFYANLIKQVGQGPALRAPGARAPSALRAPQGATCSE
jgi:hypothetical protein